MKTLRLLLVAAALSGATRAGCADLVNGIQVLVNETIITHQDLQLLIAPALDALANQFRAQPATSERRLDFEQRAADIHREGLEQLIGRQLVLSEYKSKGYSLPEALINEEVERRIRERFRGNRVDFIKTIKGEGTTLEAVRTRIREDFIYTAMRYKNVGQDLIVSPAKIEKYYQANQDKFHVEDEVKLRMIVLNRTHADDADTTRRRAEEILTRVKEGADFGELARLYSEGMHRAQGGDWGWYEKSRLNKELADIAFGLQAGQHSEVIQMPDAYYILRVEDRRAARIKPISDVRGEIEKTLMLEEQARLERAWLERLKNKAFIRYFPN